MSSSSTLIYCDTNFFLDYFLDRSDRLQPLGEFAYAVVRRTFECEFVIGISELSYDEFSKHARVTELKTLAENLRLKGKLVETVIEPKDMMIAEKLKTHYADALHVVLAKKMNA